MSSEKRLTVAYLTPRELTECRTGGWPDVLGVAAFAVDDGLLENGDMPIARVGTRPLGGQPVLSEVWRAAGPFRTGTAGIVKYRTNGNFAFGCVSIQEPVEAGAGHGHNGLAQATERAYAQILECLTEIGFPHVLRIWNYLPDINRVTGGVERYRQFNEGRQKAFQSFNRDVRGKVPAACALGSEPGSPVVIYFVADAEGGLAIENQRQVSAYDYPPQYGAFSPTFARATLSLAAAPPVLFVSGTSSIVGHETVHAGDVVRQTRESVMNVKTVMEHANREAGGELFVNERLNLKVYLRRPEDLEPVADELAAQLGDAPPILYLHAGICRADLLVEIEAVGSGLRHGAH
jgi:chorismate lyase/3-hydroxybenzoate synthase